MTRSGGNDRVDSAKQTGNSAGDHRESAAVAADRSLDDLEAQLDEHRRRLDEHEETLAATKAGLDDVGASDGASTATGGVASTATGVGAAGLLAALGLAVGTGTAQSPSADIQGEVGTGGRPVDAVYTAALAGPLTGGQRVTSLVGDGLEISNGTLTTEGT